MEFREVVNFAYSLWVQDFVNFEVSPMEARRHVDAKIEDASEILRGQRQHLSAVPDRETWGTTPEDVAAQHRMEQLALKSQKK